MMVRDIKGGMFSGKKETLRKNNLRFASYLEFYDESIIRNSAQLAFELGRNRRKKVTSLDKSNMLVSSTLWREIITEVSKNYKDIELNNEYADTAVISIIKYPQNFDVIVTSNVYGDILADMISELTGLANVLGSAELAVNRKGIYTPNQLHHPNPTLTSKNLVSPIGLIYSTGMLLDFSLKRPDLAKIVYDSIEWIFKQKLTTGEFPFSNFEILSTDELGDEIAKKVLEY